eukprot:c1269_g1_i1.p1 GENE.c1269_g1_i1~~c1269_g1_i1.p1  ORF type:complete len:297 (+),score=27.89 c1269_g1_i1:43-891(+)
MPVPMRQPRGPDGQGFLAMPNLRLLHGKPSIEQVLEERQRQEEEKEKVRLAEEKERRKEEKKKKQEKLPGSHNPSRGSSRNPSREGSRNPSRDSSPTRQTANEPMDLSWRVQEKLAHLSQQALDLPPPQPEPVPTYPQYSVQSAHSTIENVQLPNQSPECPPPPPFATAVQRLFDVYQHQALPPPPSRPSVPPGFLGYPSPPQPQYSFDCSFPSSDIFAPQPFRVPAVAQNMPQMVPMPMEYYTSHVQVNPFTSQAHLYQQTFLNPFASSGPQAPSQSHYQS